MIWGETSKSCGSSDAGIRGQLFIMNSTSANKVLNANSFNTQSPVTIFKGLFIWAEVISVPKKTF